MDAINDWKTIDAILDEALQRPADERTAYLRARCGGDVALYESVERLLAIDVLAEDALGDSVADYAKPLLPGLRSHLEAVSDLTPGERVGPYRIDGLLGRGGMGNVYLASRDDGTFTKQVALKLVRRGLDTDDILDRFQRERQVLASLDHPHIAHVLDAGATRDGRPYLVMEHVEGQPLREHCDAHRLSVEQRLRLFEQVCEAVRHAHARLVIHRDLKPSNVLVTAEGEVKLLDFGIAKVLDPDRGVAPLTRAGSRLLTPEYASPEHVRGDAVSTATDVYSLGVLLHEVLTGQRPGRALLGPESVASTPPSRLATPAAASACRMSTDALRRRLRGDLDQIVLKALADEPERRFASVEALLDDIRRHRSGLPVRARPAGRAYRAARFIGRHRVGVVMTIGTFIFLIVGIVALAIAQRNTALERHRAESELAQKQQVTAFLTDIFGAASPSETRGDTLTAFDLLHRGAERVRSELAGQPELQGHLLHILSDVYERLGSLDLALDLAEDALAKRQQVYGAHHLATAESLNRLGSVRQSLGDYDGAGHVLSEAVAMRRALLGPDHQLYAESVLNLGLNYSYSGDYEAAEPLVREALAIDRRLHGDRHADVATALNNLAVLLYFKGDYAGAEQALEEALDIRREIYGDPHPRVAITLNNLGSIQRRLGRIAEAERSLSTALEMQRRLVGDRHPDVASGLSNLAAVVSERGEHGRAVDLLLEALEIGRSALGVHPEVADALSNLGSAYLASDRPGDALVAFTEAYAVNEQTRGTAHPRTVMVMTRMATALERLGRAPEAEARLRVAFSLQEEILPPGHDDLASTAAALGKLLVADGRIAEGEPLLVRARDAYARTYGVSDARTVELSATLASVRVGPP